MVQTGNSDLQVPSPKPAHGAACWVNFLDIGVMLQYSLLTSHFLSSLETWLLSDQVSGQHLGKGECFPLAKAFKFALILQKAWESNLLLRSCLLSPLWCCRIFSNLFWQDGRVDMYSGGSSGQLVTQGGQSLRGYCRPSSSPEACS